MVMPNKKQLIIFAKTPELGFVKQRLARDIGQVEALYFYQSTLVGLINRLKGGPWSLCVSVATGQSQTHSVFDNVSTTCQPEGDMGVRMKSVLNAYADSGMARIIIGSDIPAITCAHISNAFKLLEKNDLVFGPATDGGFWLVGCAADYPTSKSVHENFMKNVRWSTSNALSDTLASVVPGISVAQVETLSDVDDGPSYFDYLSKTDFSNSQ